MIQRILNSKNFIACVLAMLTGFYTAKSYPEPLRRIRYHDADTGKNLVFLTNHFLLPSLTIAQLYKCRWQVELFFKWIKQHLRIRRFYGVSPNAVKNANLDRRLCLCAASHSSPTPRSATRPPSHFTNSQSDAVRKNADFTGSFAILTTQPTHRSTQSIGTIQLMAGQFWPLATSAQKISFNLTQTFPTPTYL
jgi:hypothetical protein